MLPRGTTPVHLTYGTILLLIRGLLTMLLYAHSANLPTPSFLLTSKKVTRSGLYFALCIFRFGLFAPVFSNSEKPFVLASRSRHHWRYSFAEGPSIFGPPTQRT